MNAFQFCPGGQPDGEKKRLLPPPPPPKPPAPPLFFFTSGWARRLRFKKARKPFTRMKAVFLFRMGPKKDFKNQPTASSRKDFKNQPTASSDAERASPDGC